MWNYSTERFKGLNDVLTIVADNLYKELIKQGDGFVISVPID